MQNILLLLSLIIFLPSITQSQELNQVDDMERKQGKWQKTYLNGVIKYEGQFRNDKPYSEFRYYYENAQLKAITKFSDDGIIAHTKSYHENGQPMADGKYINQLRDSIWNFYSDLDGKLLAKDSYKKGKLDGKSILYYAESAKPVEITEYKNGVKEGTYLKYFPEGGIMTEGSYKKDQLHGDYMVYYVDGSIEIRGRYENGIKWGNWDYYSEDGEALTEDQYKEESK